MASGSSRAFCNATSSSMGAELWRLPQSLAGAHQLAAVKEARDERAERREGRRLLLCCRRCAPSLPLLELTAHLTTNAAPSAAGRELLLGRQRGWRRGRRRRGDGRAQERGQGAGRAGRVSGAVRRQRGQGGREAGGQGLSGERGAGLRLHAGAQTQRRAPSPGAPLSGGRLPVVGAVGASPSVSPPAVGHPQPGGFQNHLAGIALRERERGERY